MKKTKGIVSQISKFILDELRNGPLKRSTIVERALAGIKNVNANTVQGTMNRLKREEKIRQVEKGIWILSGKSPEEKSKPIEPTPTPKEEAFYDSFADWLMNEVGECTIAAALGGNILGGKWGTPDVVGIYRVSDIGRYRRNEIVSFTSAEIKKDNNSSIVAFGQACSYLRFSHKVYLVLPQSTSDSEKERIESLCSIVGLGLVFFDAIKEGFPNYEIRVRPFHREPDPAALNDILDRDEVYKKLK